MLARCYFLLKQRQSLTDCGRAQCPQLSVDYHRWNCADAEIDNDAPAIRITDIEHFEL